MLLILLGMLAASYPPDRAEALSCAELMPIEKAYGYYDAVIVGHVDKVVKRGDRHELHLTVKSSYKGIRSSRIVADEDRNWGALDGPALSGAEYLFFLKSTGDGWENPLCAPSKLTSASAAELAYMKGREIPLESAADDAEGRENTALKIAAAAVFVTLGLIVILRSMRRR